MRRAVRVVAIPRYLDDGESLAEPARLNTDRAVSAGGNCDRCTPCGGDGILGVSRQAGQRLRAIVNTGGGRSLPLGGDLERNDLLRSVIVGRVRYGCLDVPCTLGVRGIPRPVCTTLLITIRIGGCSERGRCGGDGRSSKHDVAAGQAGDAVGRGLGDGELRRLGAGEVAGAGDGQGVRPCVRLLVAGHGIGDGQVVNRHRCYRLRLLTAGVGQAVPQGDGGPADGLLCDGRRCCRAGGEEPVVCVPTAGQRDTCHVYRLVYSRISICKGKGAGGGGAFTVHRPGQADGAGGVCRAVIGLAGGGGRGGQGGLVDRQRHLAPGDGVVPRHAGGEDHIVLRCPAVRNGGFGAGVRPGESTRYAGLPACQGAVAQTLPVGDLAGGGPSADDGRGISDGGG